MVPEAELQETEQGRVATGDGWYVVNARDTRWYYVQGRGAFCDLEGDQDFTQLGINVMTLGPGEAMAMYHWEADQEDFLVVSGEALLDRRGRGAPAACLGLRALPAEDEAHDRRRGSRVRRRRRRRARSTPSTTRTGAATRSTRSRCGTRPGVEQETTVPDEAYAAVRAKHGAREPTRYREGWLP